MRPLALFLGIAVSAVAQQGQPAAPPDAATQVYSGARLFDGTGSVIENAVMVVRDGRIAMVGPASSVRPPAGAPVVNLAGKFVTAGLITTHAHISDINGTRPRAYTEENTLRQLGLFARYGITTVGSLGGERG